MINILIEQPDQEKAFYLLSSIIGRLDWYGRNGRIYQQDFFNRINNPYINKMIEDRKLDAKDFYDKYFDTFAKNIYNPDDYVPIIQKLDEYVPLIQKVDEKFKALNQSWGFKIYDQYKIEINYYGAGGQYSSETGQVVLGATAGINFPDDRVPPRIIHEMIHLGIEDLIICPNGDRRHPAVLQEEKERIVDNLCIYAMDGIVESRRMRDKNGNLTAYQPIAECASYMDQVVGKQPENNLVEAVRDFINDKDNSKIRFIKKNQSTR